MPVYKSRAILEIKRGLRAFLNLEAGLARGGEVPDYEALFGQAQRRIKEQDLQMERLREQQPLDRPVADGRRNGSRRRTPRRKFHAVRRDIASRYLTGSGIEVGALHQPLEVPRRRQASVTSTG